MDTWEDEMVGVGNQDNGDVIQGQYQIQCRIISTSEMQDDRDISDRDMGRWRQQQKRRRTAGTVAS